MRASKEWYLAHELAIRYANRMVNSGGTKSWIEYYDAHMECFG